MSNQDTLPYLAVPWKQYLFAFHRSLHFCCSYSDISLDARNSLFFCNILWGYHLRVGFGFRSSWKTYFRTCFIGNELSLLRQTHFFTYIVLVSNSKIVTNENDRVLHISRDDGVQNSPNSYDLDLRPDLWPWPPWFWPWTAFSKTKPNTGIFTFLMLVTLIFELVRDMMVLNVLKNFRSIGSTVHPADRHTHRWKLWKILLLPLKWETKIDWSKDMPLGISTGTSGANSSYPKIIFHILKHT